MPATDSNSPADLGDYMNDDLFDYDADIPDLDTAIPPLDTDRKDTLGIDEEVKIRKKRVVVKLDEARYIGYSCLPGNSH